jgi:hypothetical protein
MERTGGPAALEAVYQQTRDSMRVDVGLGEKRVALFRSLISDQIMISARKWPREDWLNRTAEYRDAMRATAAPLIEQEKKIRIQSIGAITVCLGLGVLSRWAPRWRNLLSLSCGLGAIFSFGRGYLLTQLFRSAQKIPLDKAEMPLFDLYSGELHDHLAQLVREGRFTEALDQFAGKSYADRHESCNKEMRWDVKTLKPEDLVGFAYNLFDIENADAKIINKLWELRAMAMGYAAAKQTYERDKGRSAEFEALCSEINTATEQFLPTPA